MCTTKLCKSKSYLSFFHCKFFEIRGNFSFSWGSWLFLFSNFHCLYGFLFFLWFLWWSLRYLHLDLKIMSNWNLICLCFNVWTSPSESSSAGSSFVLGEGFFLCDFLGGSGLNDTSPSESSSAVSSFFLGEDFFLCDFLGESGLKDASLSSA